VQSFSVLYAFTHGVTEHLDGDGNALGVVDIAGWTNLTARPASTGVELCVDAVRIAAHLVLCRTIDHGLGFVLDALAGLGITLSGFAGEANIIDTSGRDRSTSLGRAGWRDTLTVATDLTL
jgi:hypothetical protein